MRRGFIGRARELDILAKRVDQVAAAGTGFAMAIRGRRQVGKSRLVQEFCDRAGLPYVFFAATKGASPVESIAGLLAELKESSLPAEPYTIPETAGGWPDMFRTLAGGLPDRPCVVVIDEVPWLSEQDPIFDGALQTAWDRMLAKRPVLLLLLGSDLHKMERLTAYDRPFYGRADNLILDPLSPADTASATGLSAADAIDAHLISGGLPGVLRTWPNGMPALTFLKQECADPSAAIFGIPESALLSEFPLPDQTRRVLEAVGSGDRTHANIAATAGSRGNPLPSGALSPILRRLVTDKRVLAMDEPISTQSGRPALYRVADSNLRLYLGILRAVQEQARRGRVKVAFQIVERRWTAWRGRAVEPLIREALEIAAVEEALPWTDVNAVGGWWNRQFNPEVDIVGADKAPVAGAVRFTGSIKWLGKQFDDHDLAESLTGAAQMPGFRPAQTGHVVVSRAGIGKQVDRSKIDLLWTPDDVLAVWTRPS